MTVRPLPPDLAVALDGAVSAEPAPPPRNRAERRGKARSQVPDQASRQPATGHARPAQGRRINPVRRTG